MNLLDAFLALALTMLVLATISTMFVEIIQRGLNARVRGLERMISTLFEQEVQPVFDPQGRVNSWEFVEQIIPKAGRTRPGFWVLRGFERAGRPERLEVQDFLRRLGATDVGRQFVLQNRGRLAAVEARLTHNFRNFEQRSRELFQQRAQVWSMIVGVMLAFSARIDVVAITNAYLTDDGARAEMIGRLEEVASSSPAAESVDELKELIPQGLPIGWDIEDFAAPTSTKVLLYLRLLLTGLLIGLGSPFWFDTVRALSAARALRGQQMEAGGEVSKSPSGPQPPSRPATILSEAIDSEPEDQGSIARKAWDELAKSGNAMDRDAFRDARREFARREGALLDSLERLGS